MSAIQIDIGAPKPGGQGAIERPLYISGINDAPWAAGHIADSLQLDHGNGVWTWIRRDHRHRLVGTETLPDGLRLAGAIHWIAVSLELEIKEAAQSRLCGGGA